MPIIAARDLVKSYRTVAKQPGFLGTLRHFVNRQYRTIEAVKGISFSMEPGEIVGFLGPNGAGKTTALKMLTGLIHPSGGTVEVAGYTPFSRRHDFLRRITLVMGQKQQLIWDLPVLDSLRINAAVYEIAPGEAKSRIEELAGMLGLDKQLTQPVRKLSLGERMKAELMAALLHRPEVLFLDEPTLGLDINAQAAVRDFLLDYNARYGATVLLTSHYMADIVALCKRVMMIHEGKLIYDGSLDAVFDRFAPFREVKIELKQDAQAEQLKAFGEVESVNGHEARILVRRENLPETIGRLLLAVDVVDMTVSDPPIERVIGRIFDNGSVGTHA